MPLARTFPGGANTDNLTSVATRIDGTLNSLFIRFKTTALDATARRLFQDYNSGATVFGFNCFESNTANKLFLSAEQWTTAGQWSIPVPSTGIYHDLAIAYDGGALGNTPSIWVDGIPQTVTLELAPTGTWTPGDVLVHIGNGDGATFDRCFNGDLSQYARWKGYLLTNKDVLQLSGGDPPCAVAASFLSLYAPLDAGESPEPDLNPFTRTAFTVTGTTTSSSKSGLTNFRCPAIVGVGRRMVGVSQSEW